MIKKMICLIAVLTLCAGLFAGCGETPETPEPTPGNTAQQPGTDPEQSPEPDTDTEGTPFRFTWENMPRMDGSTSLVPLARAAASLLLGEETVYVEGLTQFNRTSQSYRNLMYGSCDILIASWPAESVFTELAAGSFEYEMEPIATDALIFVVNENNPVDGLTTEQIIGIYTGEITNWQELGGNDEAIMPFQRNSGAGSQALMEKLVMGDTPMMEAPTELVAGSMGELMEWVKSYDNSSNAIGYSVYYYANDMQMAEGLKIISVDGVEPTAESIRAGEYPHLSNYYTVISADETSDSPARIMFDWLQGAEGQRLVETQGYVPVTDLTDAPKKETTPGGYAVETDWSVLGIVEPPEAKFSRLSEEWIDALAPGDDYGALYPFVGRVNYSEYGESNVYGLFDASGRIVCDPVYSSVDRCSYYTRNVEKTVPMLQLGRPDGDEMVYTLASLDGSFVSPGSYRLIRCFDFGIFCAERYDSSQFTVYDFEGNVLMTDRDLQTGEKRLERAGDVYGGQGGYMLAWLSDGSGSTAYLIDSEGKIVAGGWYSADFCGGGALSVIGSDGGNSAGVMDCGGEWIVPDKYDYIESFPGGYCGQRRSGVSHIYDLEGNALAAFENGARIMGPGYAADGSYYTTDGVCVPFGDDWSTTSYFGSSPVICRWTEDGVSLVNIYDPENSLFIPGSANGYAEQLMRDFIMGPGSALPYIIVWDGDLEHSSKLVSWNLQRVYEFDDAATGMAAFSTVLDGGTGEEYIRVNGADTAGRLYSADMDLVADQGEWTGIWNGLISKTDESFCCYWDEQGEVFFCYPLSHGGGD